MGKRGKRLVAAGIGCFIVIVVALGVAFALKAPLKVVLVGVDAGGRRAVEKFFSGTGESFRIRAVEAGSLATELGRFPAPDLVVLPTGMELAKAEGELLPIPEQLARRVPQALAWTVSEAGVPRALPILVDHFEVAWTFEAFAERGLAPPTDRSGFIRALAALREGGKPVVFCAGGDDKTLLTLLSAASVSRQGIEGYRKIVDQLRSGATPAEVLGEGGAARVAVEELRAWQRARLLPEEWTNFSPADIRAFMENRQAPIVLQTLSLHRTVPYQTIAAYASGPFPRLAAAGTPAIVAPLLAVSVPRRSLRQGRATDALSAMTTEDAGRALAEESGLATAVAAARAPDVQAADALSWAASSRTVVSGLYRDAFISPATAGDFARALREELKR